MVQMQGHPPGSALQDKAVIGQVPVGRQGRFDVGMFTQLVADMGEPGLGDPKLFYFGKRFPEGEMREMSFMTKGIEDNLAAAPDLLFLVIIDPVGIGDIGEIADAETKNGHFHMPYVDRGKCDIADGEGVLVDMMQLE